MYQYLSDAQKRKLFNGVFAVVVALAVFLGFKALNTIKEFSYIGSGVYPSNTITVSGKGSVFAIPDTGSFSFSVTEEGKTVKDAQDKASTKINSIIDAVKGMGIDEKDIKTVGYYSNPKYEYQGVTCDRGYCPPGKQILLGYEVSQTISIKVRDTEKAGEVLTKVGSLGAQNISGINFIIDDEEAVQAEARAEAIADAKDKAKVLSKSLGVRLGKIVSFNESGNYPIPYAYGMGGMMDKAVALEVSAPPQLPVGENEIVSNVTITYEVR